ncbi:unnamed protein product [Tilletia caries]|uniref:SWIM-type domain-containing protein n=2 Tax=Tilletia TaxID=13289 RepID=A0ABN7ILS1_9BASI|nr:unnamed protein product [Tilletia caries]CAD6901361.1 unnamed protein product [Tilletia caries]CAD6930450.1 unnamed protein product [Tilletia caries]CAD7061360.1 unnamed protein product [Tilletia caries]
MSSASQSDPFSRPHSPGGFSIDEEEEEEEEPASEDEEAMRRNDEHNQSILQAVLQSRGAWAPSQNRLQGLTQRKSSKQKKEKWRLVTTCNTQHLYQWFESQFNDYSSHDLSTVPWVNLTWMGHPGDSPRDLSARPWFVQFGAGVNNNSKDIATLSRKETARIVVRAHFRCLGRCVPHPVGGDEEEEDETETDADADESESKIPENSKGKGTGLARGECPDGVRLLVEVKSSDLSQAEVYMRGHHVEAKPARLQYSRRLRLYLLDVGSRIGMTPALLKNEMLHGIESADLGALPRQFTRPPFRIPSHKKVEQLMKNLRSSKRLHQDPFAAVNIFVQRNPELTFGYQKLQVRAKSFKFSVGIKSLWSIQNLIRHHGRLMHLDSSWRNKNENRSPLTFVTITNEADHMVPCAAYLSANVTAASIGSLLTALQKEVMEEVERICDLGEKELNQLRKRDPQLVKRAADIQKRGAWQPAGVMIDKCTAELNAIKTVWPEVQVRLCQFHAIQAIGRWDTDSTQNLKNRKSPGISIAQKLLICIAFREAQRCRDGAEWSQFQTAFEKEVNSILARCTAAVRKQVVSYFRENWWNDTWRDIATDIGLEDTQTRDHANTNNTIERAFKTFDNIFLACRVNKRIDRLVHILATDWLPYYEQFSSSEPRVNPEVKQMMLDAHKLWELGTAIRPGPNNTFLVWDTITTTTKQGVTLKRAKEFTVNLQGRKLGCTCLKWRQTGKRCVHMHAVAIFVKMGDVSESTGSESGLFSKQLPRDPDESRVKLPSDTAVETLVAEVFAMDDGAVKTGVKPAKEAASQPDDPKANNIPSGTSAGRPAAAQPMQPSRSKTGSSLRFSQKPGKRPKAKADILREYYSQQTVQGVQGASSPSCDESTPQSATTAAEASTANPAQPKNPIPTYEEQIQGIIRKLDSEAAGIQLPGSKISTWLVGTDFKAFLSQQWLTGTLIALWCELVRLHYHVNPRKRPLDFQGEPVEPTRTCLTSVTLFTETWDEVVMKHRIEDMEQGSLLSQDKLVCPLHLGTNHWATAVVDVGKKTVTVINSIPNEAQAKSVLAFFQEFLPRRAEHEIGKGLLAVGRGSQPDDWILATDPAAESEYPRQRDNSSCGVVTCAVILAVAKGEAPTWQNCGYKEQYISIEEADKFRRKLLSHLVPHIRFVDSKPAEK